MPELPVPSLADDVVLLRPWREADVPAQLAAFGDLFFLRFSDWAPQTEAGALAYLAGHEQARRRGEQIELALVEPHDESVLLGGGSLNNVDLAPRRLGVPGLRVARLELICGPDNLASQRVAERCGFTREGVLRSHVPFKGARRDSVVIRLLPGELR